jgi:hypothetical protein
LRGADGGGSPQPIDITRLEARSGITRDSDRVRISARARQVEVAGRGRNRPYALQSTTCG